MCCDFPTNGEKSLLIISLGYGPKRHLNVSHFYIPTTRAEPHTELMATVCWMWPEKHVKRSQTSTAFTQRPAVIDLDKSNQRGSFSKRTML